MYHRFKSCMKKLLSLENQIYIKNPFGIVIETAFSGCKFVTFYSMEKYDKCFFHWHEYEYFVNLTHTVKQHWNLYAWPFVLYQQQPGKTELHTTPFFGWTWITIQPKHDVILGDIILSKLTWLKIWVMTFLRVFFLLLAFPVLLLSAKCLRYLLFHTREDILILILHFHQLVRQNLFPYLMVWCIFQFLGKADRLFLTWGFMTFCFLRRRGCSLGV